MSPLVHNRLGQRFSTGCAAKSLNTLESMLKHKYRFGLILHLDVPLNF